MFDEVEEAFTVQLGSKHPSTLGAKGSLAAIMMEEGQLSDAQALTLDIVEDQAAQLGPNHASTLLTRICLANVMMQRG